MFWSSRLSNTPLVRRLRLRTSGWSGQPLKIRRVFSNTSLPCLCHCPIQLEAWQSFQALLHSLENCHFTRYLSSWGVLIFCRNCKVPSYSNSSRSLTKQREAERQQRGREVALSTTPTILKRTGGTGRWWRQYTRPLRQQSLLAA